MSYPNESFNFLTLPVSSGRNVPQSAPFDFDINVKQQRNSGLGSYTAALAGGTAVTPQIVRNDSMSCPVCSKNMRHMNPVARQTHVDGCLNTSQTSSRLSKKFDDWRNTVDCPLCKEPQAPGPFRAAHIKRCASKYGVEPKDVLNIVSAQQNVADALKRSGLPHTSASVPTREDVMIKRKRDPDMPKSVYNEDIQTALALSLQEGDLPVIRQKSGDSMKSSGSSVASTSSLNSEAGLNAARQRLCDIVLMNDAPSSSKSFASKFPPLKRSKLAIDPSLSSLLFGRSAVLSCPTPKVSTPAPSFTFGKAISNDLPLPLSSTNHKMRSFTFDNDLSANDEKHLAASDSFVKIEHEEAMDVGDLVADERKLMKVDAEVQAKPVKCELVTVGTQTEAFGSIDQGTDPQQIVMTDMQAQCDLMQEPPKDVYCKCSAVVDRNVDGKKDETSMTYEQIVRNRSTAETQILMETSQARDVVEEDRIDEGQDDVVNKSYESFLYVPDSSFCLQLSPSPMDRPIGTPDLFDEESAIGHLLHDDQNVHGEGTDYDRKVNDVNKLSPVVDLVSPGPAGPAGPSGTTRKADGLRPKCSEKTRAGLTGEHAVTYVNVGSSDESKGKSPASIGVTPPNPIVPENTLWQSPLERVARMKQVGLEFSDLEFATEDFEFKAKIEGVLRAKNMTIPEKISTAAPNPLPKTSPKLSVCFSFDDAQRPEEPVPSDPTTPADSGVKILKTDNITPLPDYDQMDTPGLKKELGKFGLRPMVRKRATPLLRQIYEKTHPVAETVDFLRKSASDDVVIGSVDEDENEMLEESLMGSSPDEEVTESLEKRLVKMIKDNAHLHNKVLMYETIPFDEIHEVMVANEIKCSKKALMDFLDKKHVTFTLKSNRNDKQKRKGWKRK